jgi:hypothetical protein
LSSTEDVSRFIDPIPTEASAFNIKTIEDLDRAILYTVSEHGRVSTRPVALRYLTLLYNRKASKLETSVLQQCVALHNAKAIYLHEVVEGKRFLFSREMLAGIIEVLRSERLEYYRENAVEYDAAALDSGIKLELRERLDLIARNYLNDPDLA